MCINVTAGVDRDWLNALVEIDSTVDSTGVTGDDISTDDATQCDVPEFQSSAATAAATIAAELETLFDSLDSLDLLDSLNSMHAVHQNDANGGHISDTDLLVFGSALAQLFGLAVGHFAGWMVERLVMAIVWLLILVD